MATGSKSRAPSPAANPQAASPSLGRLDLPCSAPCVSRNDEHPVRLSIQVWGDLPMEDLESTAGRGCCPEPWPGFTILQPHKCPHTSALSRGPCPKCLVLLRRRGQGDPWALPSAKRGLLSPLEISWHFYHKRNFMALLP